MSETEAPKRWSIAPYFIVDDVVASANYYRDKLGFQFERFWGEPPCFTMVWRRGVVIMLSQVEKPGLARPNHVAEGGDAWDAYVWVDDADALLAEYRAKGVKITRDICDQPYGCRDFDVEDINGYRLCFGHDTGKVDENADVLVEPAFREAVDAIDAGNVEALAKLIDADPTLVTRRGEHGKGYFAKPYLLWYVAENPVRRATLPANIVEVARFLVGAAKRATKGDVSEQIDYALGLVASGRVPRERGVQRALIEAFVEMGANTNAALQAAIAHRELEAIDELLKRGASLTLLAAIAVDRADDATRLIETASAEDRHLALVASAYYGRVELVRALIRRGVNVNIFAPEGFHAHGTVLHHAVDGGSLDVVKLLVGAGGDPTIRDKLFKGTPLDWANYLNRTEIAAYLKSRT